MKSELAKTLCWAGVALALTIAALSVEPETHRAAVFSDQGEPLLPAFRDVTAVRAIEVIDYNEADATARPLKVEFRNGSYVLASHYDYPAQSGDRLAKTAAALLDLKKDIVVSDRVEDHGKYGVIDPLDTKVASLTGRGKRVTLRDKDGAVLADLILGPRLKDKPGYRYVRLPGAKRIYAVKTDADPSAAFEDWAEPSLLRLSSDQVRAITLLNYSMSGGGAGLARMEQVTLRRDGDAWKADGGGRVRLATLQTLLAALANLKVAGVRPKPPDMARQLKGKGGLELTLDAMLSLRQRGFFLTQEGRLLASEGELLVDAANGVSYTLRFGEPATTQEGKPAGRDEPKSPEANRFLFITASWNAARALKYGGGTNGEAIADAQRAKFAGWYYIISGADFQKLRPARSALVE
jgi:hypothetical protein